MFERKKQAGKIYFLPIDQIRPSPFQARREFSEQELAALAQSIRENGLLQPISVRKVSDGGYELVAGERRLRACRLAKGMTQEQLANEVGVVVTHISHIETGNSVPSLKTLIDIINALDCSADELLCIEIKKAKPVFDSWMSEQLADCSADEAKIIKEMVVSLKKSLRKVYGKSSKYRYD